MAEPSIVDPSPAPDPGASPAPAPNPAPAPGPGDAPAPSPSPSPNPAPAPQPAPAPAAPEKYELKAPEGVELPPEVIDKAAAVARELGLSNEAAQRLLDHEVGVRQEIAKGQADALMRTVGEWEQSVKADPELGKENLEATLTHGKRVLDRFATPELKKALLDTGYVWHPELVRFITRIGRAMAEDKLERSGATADQVTPLEERLYGKPSS